MSLGTGAGVGEHGVLGFTLRRPGTDELVIHVLWRDDPPPQRWQPLPTWYQRIAAAGHDVRVVLPHSFEGSGLTDAAYRGARFCGLVAGEDPAARLLAELEDGARLVYGYTPVLDTAAHVHGVGSPQWLDAAGEVDAYLSRVREGLPPDTALLVTADHGGLNAGPDDRIDLDTDPDLAAGLHVVAGEPRVRHLHTVPGAAADVAATWGERLGDRADVLVREQAVAAGLFGPVAAPHLERIGDVVVVCRQATVVLASRREPASTFELVGFHGALTDAETAIPLLYFPGG